jgi:dTDP-4-dehydrorhamnose 3,5-epimerase
MSEQSLLEVTLNAAVRDRQTVTGAGEYIRRLTHGVKVHDLPTHPDDRGSVTELFDPRWGIPDPVAYAYTFTIHPGYCKGWNLHRENEDRYAILSGEMELVLFDPRPESPTCGEVCRIVLSEHHRCLVNVPPNVWHADRNIGTRNVVVINFPTKAYDHANPDKYRLPLNTKLIPHSFGPISGW